MKKARYLLKENFVILVADDSLIFDDPNWEEVVEYVFTEAVVKELFDTDHTGVTKNEDGTYTADESAMERARKLDRFKTTDIGDPGK